MTAPCSCWLLPVVLHDGHCCFGDDPTPPDQIVPGGHWIDEETR